MSMRDHGRSETLKALEQIEGSHKPAPKRSQTQAMATEEPAEKPEPFVSFSINKKVGDAEIHASGPLGSEAKARELVQQAADRLKK